MALPTWFVPAGWLSPAPKQMVTGLHVSPAPFQAQGVSGLMHRNSKFAREDKKSNLSTLFDPCLAVNINQASILKYGVSKYPDVYLQD